MTTTALLTLLMLLQVKHLVADYFLQSAWMVRTKGIYGHPGGLAHSGIHVLLSVPVLAVTGLPPAWIAALALGEGVLHYHIDWGKQRFTGPGKLTPADSAFWNWMGVDQFLHQVTYLGMAHLILQFAPL